MTGADIARRFGVHKKTVTHNWVQDGCPRNKNKTFDLDKVIAWRKAKIADANSDPAVKLQQGKTALQSKRLMLQCEKLETEISVTKGKLHDRHACSASLTAIRSAETLMLMSLGDRLAARFPENGAAIKQAADEEIRAMLERLHGNGAYDSEKG